jgi:hypothetical protein
MEAHNGKLGSVDIVVIAYPANAPYDRAAVTDEECSAQKAKAARLRRPGTA